MAVAQVNTAIEARPLFDEVCRWAARLGMRFNGIPVRVRLTGTGRHRPGHLGCTLHSRSWRGRKLLTNRIRGIQIAKGLTPLEFQGVVAHELGHVWLALRQLWLPTIWEEGFCELLAHRFYVEAGTPESLQLAREIEFNPDPVYGGGFRALRERLGAGGLEGILRTGRFPRVRNQNWSAFLIAGKEVAKR